MCAGGLNTHRKKEKERKAETRRANKRARENCPRGGTNKTSRRNAHDDPGTDFTARRTGSTDAKITTAGPPKRPLLLRTVRRRSPRPTATRFARPPLDGPTGHRPRPHRSPCPVPHLPATHTHTHTHTHTRRLTFFTQRFDVFTFYCNYPCGCN